MTRKINWTNMEKATKDLKRKIKNISAVSDYLKDKPETGMIKDNISKKIIEISKAKSSSLRRYVKLMDNFYYLITAQADREWILSKKIELETELNSREDAFIKNQD